MVKTFLALFIFVSFALAQTQVETQNGTFITLGTGANQDTAQQASKFLKNADSTTLKAGLLKNADSTTLKAGLLKNADSTTIRNYDNNLYSLKAGSSSIVTVGAVNSGSFGSSFRYRFRQQILRHYSLTEHLAWRGHSIALHRMEGQFQL